jgi:phosphatidylinositol alpha-1,6-mannosyltransferase
MVFLEANAAGKPVIGGRSGGAIEAIEEGRSGFLVNPHDAGELASCLKRLLLDHGLREELGSAGLQRVRTEFDWKVRAERLREINRLILTAHSDPEDTRDGQLGKSRANFVEEAVSSKYRSKATN